MPGYADKLQGDDRVVLKLRPGITGPATLKYRLEDEMIADFVGKVRSGADCGFALPDGYEEMSDQELAVWYNDTVIYPDKVRLNKYYYEHMGKEISNAASVDAQVSNKEKYVRFHQIWRLGDESIWSVGSK